MNQTIILGRICKDLELKKTPSQKSVLSFTLAVDRKFKDASGNKKTDFINCVAWEKTADNIEKYFGKGSKILISGEIQTRDYQSSDGKKVFVTEILVSEFDFCESKKDVQDDAQYTADDDTTNAIPFDL